MWNALLPAEQSRLSAKSHSDRVPLKEVLMDRATDAIVDMVVPASSAETRADWKTADSPGWARIWKMLTTGEQTKLKHEGEARGISPLDVMVEIMKAELKDGPMVPAHGALHPMPGDDPDMKRMKSAMRARLITVAEKTGAPAPDLIRLGVHRVCQEFEASGSVRFGGPLAPQVQHPGGSDSGTSRDTVFKSVLDQLTVLGKSADTEVCAEAKSLASRLRVMDSALVIREDHAAIYRGAARIVGVDVQDLLDLLLGHHTRDLSDESNGLMDGVVSGMVDYSSPAEKRGAESRLKKWLAGAPLDTAPHPFPVRLTVNAEQSAALTEVADMMEVDPGLFLRWMLEYEIENLNDPYDGLRQAWAHDLLVYDSVQEEARVKARVAEWEKTTKVVKEQAGRRAAAAATKKQPTAKGKKAASRKGKAS